MSRHRAADDGDESPGPNYHVPALEKGLDILECLAAQGVPLTQAQLARTLGRRPSELFRMLTTLERRGYVQRDPLSGAYSLTLRLFELGHAHSPYDGLLRAAERPMRALTEEVRQSCHLSVIHGGQLLVLAEEQSPTRIR
ncbi:MAG: IclR family transcriptional regulator, partial [Thermomicrobiales bacterium]